MLDEAEVTNAEYYAYMQAKGATRPSYWRHVPDMPAFLADFGDYPATSMSWNDARAYAEWVGKRLPTLAEWHRAAGGLDNWPFPYSPNPDAEILSNVLEPRTVGLAAPGESHREA